MVHQQSHSSSSNASIKRWVFKRFLKVSVFVSKYADFPPTRRFYTYQSEYWNNGCLGGEGFDLVKELDRRNLLPLFSSNHEYTCSSPAHFFGQRLHSSNTSRLATLQKNKNILNICTLLCFFIILLFENFNPIELFWKLYYINNKHIIHD